MQITVDGFWYYTKIGHLEVSWRLVPKCKLKLYHWTACVLIHEKSICLSSPGMEFLPVHDFVASCIDYFKNIASLSYADLSKYWHISWYNIKNITFVTITIDLIRKVFMFQKAVQLMVADTSFLSFFCKFQIFINESNLLHNTSTWFHAFGG